MTPQEEIQVRQMIANQMSAPRQPMFRAQMPDMDPTPRMTIATPEAEQAEYRRQRQALENAARFSGLLGNTPTPNPTTNYRSPYSREEIERLMRDEEAQRLGLRPPTDAERARLDANSQVNPEMPLNDLARARLDAERAAMDGSLPMLPPPIPPVGGEVAADPEPEEYDVGGPADISLVYCLAEAGDVEAQVWLGSALLDGQHVEKDPKAALGYFKRAARQGHVCAQWYVAQAYLTGKGVKKNLKLAEVWMRRAAKQGCNCALLAIDAGCLDGKTLPPDCKVREGGCAGE